MKLLAAWAAVCLGTPAWACLNDIDTRRLEAEASFGVKEMAAGRFEVNPPAYYQVRIAVARRRIADGGAKPGDYDDLAVALERLGQTDEAIKAILAKEALRAKFTKDDIYRSHANYGTFLAHKALKSSPPDKTLLARALKELEAAIKINPEAHFGREQAQIELVRALAEGKDMPVYFEPKDKTKNAYFGIIVMGSGQESPDMWMLAARHSTYTEGERLLLAAKVKTLQGKGKKFHFKGLEQELGTIKGRWSEALALLDRLQENGKEYQAARTAFMKERLALYGHPDEKPDFWAGYEPVPPYETTPAMALSNWFWGRGLVFIIYGGAALALIGAVLLAVWGLVAKGRPKASA